MGGCPALAGRPLTRRPAWRVCSVSQALPRRAPGSPTRESAVSRRSRSSRCGSCAVVLSKGPVVMALVSPILSLIAARRAARSASIRARVGNERKGFSHTHRSGFQAGRPCSIFGAGEARFGKYSTGIPVLVRYRPTRFLVELGLTVSKFEQGNARESADAALAQPPRCGLERSELRALPGDLGLLPFARSTRAAPVARHPCSIFERPRYLCCSRNMI